MYDYPDYKLWISNSECSGVPFETAPVDYDCSAYDGSPFYNTSETGTLYTSNDDKSNSDDAYANIGGQGGLAGIIIATVFVAGAVLAYCVCFRRSLSVETSAGKNTEVTNSQNPMF
jgi:hypothetical protein